ncbi:MAG: AMIN domain-containing protein [Gemmatimonadota bacterium]
MISFFAAVTAALMGVTGGPVTQLSILPVDQRTEVIIAVEGTVEFRDFTMNGPNRLVVDLFGTRHALGKDNFVDIHRGGVRSVRTSQYSDDVVRVVLELDREVGYQVVAGNGYVRLALENNGGAFEPWSSEVEGGARLASLVGERATSPRPAAQAAEVETLATGRVGARIRRSDDPARRMTVSFTNMPLSDVLFTFAEFAGRSIVPGAGISGSVTADIRDQPWDIALQEILDSHGLAARERESGIIRVDALERLSEREVQEPTATRTFRISFGVAGEIQTALQPLLTDRGRLAVSQGTNTIVATDVPRVLSDMELLIRELDVRTPNITIAAKIIFVNRTDLNEFGVTYDLKDMENGNQLNQILPGGVFENGVFQPVEVGTDVVQLRGNSVAALGNANSRVIGPSLSILTSLVMGRSTLLTFIEALQSVNLSDVQAAPQTTTQDNHTSRIVVGEETPLRVIDAAAAGQGAALAAVEIKETGIILEVTPHITAGDLILLTVRAERSAAEIADSDIGLIFTKQEATSRVLVQDGHAAVIGGLTVTERSEVRTGIPILMSLPYAGRFFRVTREQQVQRDLMIMVTPYINR